MVTVASGNRVLAVALLAVALTAFGASDAWAQRNQNPGVFPPNSRPYGMSYTDWAEKWQQWWASIPADQNPMLDPDGRFCNVGQSGPVFFLGNDFGGTTVRSCSVPAGKSLLISPGGTNCILHIDAETEAGLRTCVEQTLAGIANVQVDVDGVPLQDFGRYLIETPLFSFTLPMNNVFGLLPGEYQTVLGGLFLMLTPLPAGQHVIHFHDEFPAFSFIADVTYHITVR